MKKNKNSRLFLLVLFFGLWFYLLPFTFTCFASEITILYTGDTHAMLYPCNCPIEPDGGIARRATLVKQLKKNNPNTLLLDSGAFFAGGLMDEYTQNIDLDRERTLINLKAIEMIGYDALTIGDDEFNFNKEFLFANIAKIHSNFLSSNIKSDKLLPYLIKDINTTKIGIIGLTNLLAKQKTDMGDFIEPEIAVKKSVEELKEKKADIIILLSHQGESDDLRLLEEVQGIDIIITGHARNKEEPYAKVGNALIVRPSWEGRRLGKISLTLKDNKIVDYKVEELRLSDEINDDPQILSILPRCFSDLNCKKEAMIGKCQDSGTLKSQCVFSERPKVSLSIIAPKDCKFCDMEKIAKYLKIQFPGLVIFYLYYPDNPEAGKLIKNFQIKAMPAYLLGKEAKEEKGFDSLKNNLEIKGDFYMLKPEFGGVSYFLDRKKIKGKLDLFIGLYDKDTPALLEMIRDSNPTIHFLAVENKDNFDAAKGNLEIEEYLRCACVEKYYPKIFLDYLICRAKNINSFWWEDCLGQSDSNKIKICARSDEGKALLRENIGLNKELKVMFGPVYLLDNQGIFGIQGVPKKEAFKKLIER